MAFVDVQKAQLLAKENDQLRGELHDRTENSAAKIMRKREQVVLLIISKSPTTTRDGAKTCKKWNMFHINWWVCRILRTIDSMVFVVEFLLV